MASNGKDLIQLSPEQLHDMANLFQQASQDTSTILDDLKKPAQQLIDVLYSELKHSPEALQLVWDLCNKALNSEKDFLQEVSHIMHSAASSFKTIDQNAIPKG